MVVLKNLILKSKILLTKKYNILIQKCDSILKSPVNLVQKVQKMDRKFAI